MESWPIKVSQGLTADGSKDGAISLHGKRFEHIIAASYLDAGVSGILEGEVDLGGDVHLLIRRLAHGRPRLDAVQAPLLPVHPLVQRVQEHLLLRLAADAALGGDEPQTARDVDAGLSLDQVMDALGDARQTVLPDLAALQEGEGQRIK